MKFNIINNSNDIIRYVGNDNKGSLIIGVPHSNTTKKSIYYITDIKNDLYKGYIVAECNEYPDSTFYLTAYVNVKGKNIRLAEQHHSKFSGEYLQYNDALSATKKAIKELHNYINSNWLEKKPKIKKEILKYNWYKERIFNYNGNDYILIVDDNSYKNYIIGKNKQGNEMFKVQY